MSSPLNALTHGLTSNHLLDDHERDLMANTIQFWIDEHGSTCDAEATILASAAMGKVRADRCVRAETAALKLAKTEAQRRYLERQRHRVRKLAQSLPTEPSHTLEALEATGYGCDWLIRQWQSIDTALAQGIRLCTAQRTMCMQLCGYYDIAPGPDADLQVRLIWGLLQIAVNGGPLKADDYDLQLNRRAGYVTPPDMPTNPVAVRALLRQLVTSRLSRLQALRQKHYEETDKADLEFAATTGLVDLTDEGKLRTRYAQEAERTIRANLSLLDRVRKNRRLAEEADRREAYRKPRTYRDDPTPQPSRNEPSPAECHASLTPTAPTAFGHSSGTNQAHSESAPAPKITPNHDPETLQKRPPTSAGHPQATA
jgi:hypothetical protein